jgi:hypothetical protein
MCGIFFQKNDHVDCKIIAFKVKRWAFSVDFEFPWLNYFSLLRVGVFDTIVVEWVENPKK